MIDHLRSGVDDPLQRLAASLEIRDQDLDAAVREARAQQVDATGEMFRAPVGQVVPGDRGDDDVAEPEGADGLHEALRFVGVHRRGRPLADVAVAAAPRAGVAQDEERGRSRPEALAPVGAEGFLADAVETEFGEGARDPAVRLAARQADLEPRGFPERVNGYFTIHHQRPFRTQDP